MTNSASFELRESSTAASSPALFLRRSSKVGMDRPGANYEVDESLPLDLEEETS